MTLVLKNNIARGIIYALCTFMGGFMYRVFTVYQNAGRAVDSLIVILAMLFLAVGLYAFTVVFLTPKATYETLDEVYSDIKGVDRFWILLSGAIYITFLLFALVLGFSGNYDLSSKYEKAPMYFKEQGMDDDTKLFLDACPTWFSESTYATADTIYSVQELLDDGIDINDKQVTLLLDNMDAVKRGCKIQGILDICFAIIFGIAYSYSQRTKTYIMLKKEWP